MRVDARIDSLTCAQVVVAPILMWSIGMPSLLLYVCRSITCAPWLACMLGGVVIRMAVMPSALVSYRVEAIRFEDVAWNTISGIE